MPLLSNPLFSNGARRTNPTLIHVEDDVIGNNITGIEDILCAGIWNPFQM